MKKEATLLFEKAVNSLILSIEHFNRPWDCGRTDAVLILLDHAFEMLLKAAIIHRRGRIRRPGAKQTIGFNECVNRALTGKKLMFLTEEQALLLQAINSLRDAAQHHLVTVSEQHLYIQAQAGLTLFRDILVKVFGTELQTQLPERVLPISTTPPIDLCTLFERSGKRRGTEVEAKLRGLAIVEGAMNGQSLQPSDNDLIQIKNAIQAGKQWGQVFPGVASINITSLGYGHSIDLRITKNEGIKVQLVPEGTPAAEIVAVKRVNELDFYNLSRDQLAMKVGLSGPKTTAIIRYLDLQSDSDCYKEFIRGKTRLQGYSQKAITKIKDLLKDSTEQDIEAVWLKHGIRKRRK